MKANHIGFFILRLIKSVPLVDAFISAGFVACRRFIGKLDLNRQLIKNPSSTFFARVRGTSMTDVGINDGDILIIDKSLEAKHNSVLVCFIDGEFTVKKVQKIKGELFLIPQSKDFAPIKVSRESDFRLWGVVTYCIHKLH